VAAGNRFDKRKNILVGGYVESWLGAGLFDLVTTRDHDLGKLSRWTGHRCMAVGMG
jgi:hypothetical protein